MEIIIVLTIIMLCTSNMVVLGLILFLILNKSNFSISTKSNRAGSNDQENRPALSPKEEAEIERARRRYIETEEAFEDMMNFNAYQAYGMNQPNKEE